MESKLPNKAFHRIAYAPSELVAIGPIKEHTLLKWEAHYEQR